MITPISLFNIHKSLSFKGVRKDYQTCVKSAQDVYKPSVEEEKQSRFEQELKNLDKMRCARCKQKMLTEQRYKNIMERMAQVKDGHGLQKIIEENKDYLTDSNSLILKDLENINTKYPDADLIKVLRKIHFHAGEIYEETCDNNINLLSLVTEKLHMTDHDKMQYLKTIEELKAHKENKPFNIQDFTVIMYDTIKNTDYLKKQKLFDKVLLHQTRAYNYYKNIEARHLTSQEPHNALKALCEGLFKRSKSELSDIYKKEEKFKHVNKILICRDCSHKTKNSSRYYKFSDDNEKLKENFIQYLQDLNSAIDNKRIHIDKNYIDNLIKHVQYASGRRIMLNKNDLQFLEYKKKITDLPFKDKEDIPCPGCNGIMLTHAQREKIDRTIEESGSIKELYDILKENEKYLPPTMKLFAEKFRDIYIRDPYISDVLMRKKFQAFVLGLTRNEYNKFLSAINKKLKDSSYKENDKQKLKELKLSLQNYSQKVNLFYDSSKINTIILDSHLIEPEDIFNLRDEYDKLFINLELLQGPVYHSKSVSERKNKTWSKIFTQRVIRKAVFTKDHMIARIDGGSDNLDNKMGMHRECNQRKGKKPLKQWYREDPEKEFYTTNYLKKINELSQDGAIKGCKDYAENIANKIFFLTGKQKPRNEFCKKDSR